MIRFVDSARRLAVRIETLVVLFALAAAGCSREEPIRHYEAPKEEGTEAAPGAGAMVSGSAPAAAASLVQYKAPEGWSPGEVGGLRKAAFVVADGDKKVEITVIDLMAAAGELLPNVNRWRGQIQLGPITQAELDKAAQPIQVSGVEGTYIELLGPEESKPRQAILGVVAVAGPRAWFIKMWGDAELALREKERFQAFARSVKFATGDGAGHDD